MYPNAELYWYQLNWFTLLPPVPSGLTANSGWFGLIWSSVMTTSTFFPDEVVLINWFDISVVPSVPQFDTESPLIKRYKPQFLSSFSRVDSVLSKSPVCVQW